MKRILRKGSHIRIPIFGNAIFNSTMKISVDAHMDMNFQGCDCYLCGVVIVAYMDDTDSTLVRLSHRRNHEVSAAKKRFSVVQKLPITPLSSPIVGLEWLRYNEGAWMSLLHQRTCL